MENLKKTFQNSVKIILSTLLIVFILALKEKREHLNMINCFYFNFKYDIIKEKSILYRERT